MQFYKTNIMSENEHYKNTYTADYYLIKIMA